MLNHPPDAAPRGASQRIDGISSLWLTRRQVEDQRIAGAGSQDRDVDADRAWSAGVDVLSRAMSHYREPPIDTVVRFLARAAEVAAKRRVVREVRERIEFALTTAFAEMDRQIKAGRRK